MESDISKNHALMQDFFDGAVIQNFDRFRVLLSEFQQRVDNKTKIHRYEWNLILLWIREDRETRWIENHHLFKNFDVEKLMNEARHLTIVMEDLYWQQTLNNLIRKPIFSIQSVKAMLKDTREVDGFLSTNDLDSSLRTLLRQMKEKLAWYRAIKKTNEAYVSEASGRLVKAEKFRKEAQSLLQQDWNLVFPGEQWPEIGDIHPVV